MRGRLAYRYFSASLTDAVLLYVFGTGSLNLREGGDERLVRSNPHYIIVCREAVTAKLLHAVTEMVESTHQCCLIGESIKPPKGALVKSHGTERLGKD